MWRGAGIGHVDIDPGTLLQMMGRAGRPGFDTCGTAAIMTDNKSKKRYEQLSMGMETVESRLLGRLIDTNLSSHLCHPRRARAWSPTTLPTLHSGRITVQFLCIPAELRFSSSASRQNYGSIPLHSGRITVQFPCIPAELRFNSSAFRQNYGSIPLHSGRITFQVYHCLIIPPFEVAEAEMRRRLRFKNYCCPHAMFRRCHLR